MDLLLVSPGISSTGKNKHKILKKINNDKVEIINDIELFYRFNPDEKYIGVTGTNGKSTTVSLLNHTLKKLKIKSTLGGNIGKPVFDLKRIKKSFCILEISSFQLELMKRTKFKVAILLNITKDHLDRHGNLIIIFLKKLKFLIIKIKMIFQL